VHLHMNSEGGFYNMKQISFEQLNINPITAIRNDWMLITAGNADAFNTMTASWGHIGSLWGSNGGNPTTTIFIRPQRYTKEFVDREDVYTLCFFPDGFKKQLAYLGAVSGRDEDKVAKMGLTPVFEDGYTYFKEASLVICCRKLYHAPIAEEGFVDPSIVEENYPDRDFHEMYVGKIEKILIAD